MIQFSNINITITIPLSEACSGPLFIFQRFKLLLYMRRICGDSLLYTIFLTGAHILDKMISQFLALFSSPGISSTVLLISL